MTPRRLRAPRQNGAVVADPALETAGAMIAANRRLATSPAPLILGRPAHAFRTTARHEAVAAALDYFRQTGEPAPPVAAPSLLVAGHQPELFHPGVWVKNFALNGLCRAHGSTPLNLIVDNDTAKATTLRLPALAGLQSPWPHPLTLPFDDWTGEVPHEERAVRNESLFADLANRAAPVVAGWPFEPMLSAFWREGLHWRERTKNLGERLAGARRTFERLWGCHNLELPVSRLCATESFAWFAGDLLSKLPRFHQVYNASVRDYRRHYGIRSRNHPVPDLAAGEDWLEAPFWAWEKGQQQRSRLWARVTDGGIELRVGSEPWPTLPNDRADPARLVRAYRELEKRGLKVRSRALTNTLFARLFLADLFIHGIGGGKYDELTDTLLQRHYGVEPPGYLVLTATLLLPLPTYPSRPDTCRRLALEVRDLHYNPQRHLESLQGNGRLEVLLAQKQQWIRATPANSTERRERFLILRQLTEQLRAFVAPKGQAQQQALTQAVHEVEANAVLERRDYAFPLYPETALRRFLTRFLQKTINSDR